MEEDKREMQRNEAYLKAMGDRDEVNKKRIEDFEQRKIRQM